MCKRALGFFRAAGGADAVRSSTRARATMAPAARGGLRSSGASATSVTTRAGSAAPRRRPAALVPGAPLPAPIGGSRRSSQLRAGRTSPFGGSPRTPGSPAGRSGPRTPVSPTAGAASGSLKALRQVPEPGRSTSSARARAGSVRRPGSKSLPSQDLDMSFQSDRATPRPRPRPGSPAAGRGVQAEQHRGQASFSSSTRQELVRPTPGQRRAPATGLH